MRRQKRKKFNSRQDMKTRRVKLDDKIAPKTRIKILPKAKRAE